MRQRLLQIVAASRRDLLDFGAQEIVIPGAGRIVILGHRNVIEPYLDRDEQPLRTSHLELVKADVGLNRERFEQDAGRSHLEALGDETRELGFGEAHASPKNCTSRSSARKRCPESITSTWPVTHLPSTK